MRIAIVAKTSPSLLIALGAALAIWLDDHSHTAPEPGKIVLEIESPTPPIEMASSIASRDGAPPPPVPSPPYAALFVAGATWTLPCVYHDFMGSHEATRPGGELRCVADRVHEVGEATLVRHTCVRDHTDPRLPREESIVWFVMTDDGLYRVFANADGSPGRPSTTFVEPPKGRFRASDVARLHEQRPIFARRPRVEGVDYTEARSGANIVRAITRRGDAWCRLDYFANGDGGSGETFCISKSRGFIGRAIPYVEGGWTDRCGETF